jgi:hypothetical protein
MASSSSVNKFLVARGSCQSKLDIGDAEAKLLLRHGVEDGREARGVIADPTIDRRAK